MAVRQRDVAAEKKGINCGVGCGCIGCENQEQHQKQHETSDMQSDLSASSSDESDTGQENENPLRHMSTR